MALTTLAVLARPAFGYYLVVDAHNECVRPFDRPYAPVRWLSRRLLKSADTTLVSNEALAGDVREAGGRPLVLPDRLPEPSFGKPQPAERGGAPEVAVIATYRPDEPVDAILAAAAMLPDVTFAFSGPAERYPTPAESLPPNVRFTGFLEEEDYWKLLVECRVVCDLTLKPDCLVCGAYEALALAKAMVLSDNPPTREIFGSAAILTDEAPVNIAEAVRRALEQRERLEAGARALRDTFPDRWQAQSEISLNAIRSACGMDIRSNV